MGQGHARGTPAADRDEEPHDFAQHVGVVGVRLVHAVRRREEKEYPDWRWIAFWPGCPNAGGIGWSVNKYGDERAFVNACLARKLESIDRDAIDAEYEVFRKTRDYKRLLKLKQITPA
jgi:hypothetical protein